MVAICFHLSFLSVLVTLSCVGEHCARAQEHVRAKAKDDEDGGDDTLLVSERGGGVGVPTVRSEAVVMNDGTVHVDHNFTQIRSLSTEFPYLGSPPQPSDIASFRPLGGGRFDEYKSGDSPYLISRHLRDQSDDLARQRRSFVVDAMKHAWSGYKTFAFGHDELLPVSRKGANPWGGMAVTLVDSLDTLWLMGLTDEFYEGRDWVRDVSLLFVLFVLKIPWYASYLHDGKVDNDILDSFLIVRTRSTWTMIMSRLCLYSRLLSDLSVGSCPPTIFRWTTHFSRRPMISVVVC